MAAGERNDEKREEENSIVRAQAFLSYLWSEHRREPSAIRPRSDANRQCFPPRSSPWDSAASDATAVLPSALAAATSPLQLSGCLKRGVAALRWRCFCSSHLAPPIPAGNRAADKTAAGS